MSAFHKQQQQQKKKKKVNSGDDDAKTTATLYTCVVVPRPLYTRFAQFSTICYRLMHRTSAAQRHCSLYAEKVSSLSDSLTHCHGRRECWWLRHIKLTHLLTYLLNSFRRDWLQTMKFEILSRESYQSKKISPKIRPLVRLRCRTTWRPHRRSYSSTHGTSQAGSILAANNNSLSLTVLLLCYFHGGDSSTLARSSVQCRSCQPYCEPSLFPRLYFNKCRRPLSAHALSQHGDLPLRLLSRTETLRCRVYTMRAWSIYK